MSSVCVVLPVYNEIQQVRKTLESIFEYTRRHPNINFLIVDDGSTDGTRSYLQEVLRPGLHPRVDAIHYQPNRGKGYAIQTGFAQTKADYLIFMDGDLAYSLDHLPTVIEQLAHHEVVIGSREIKPYHPRRSSFQRRVMGSVFNKLTRLMTGLPYRDTQAGLKGFQRHAAQRIFKHKRINGFGFDVEVLFLAQLYQYRVAEIYARVDGEHSYKDGKLQLLRHSLEMFIDLLRIRWYNWLGDYYCVEINLLDSFNQPPFPSLATEVSLKKST